MTKAGASAHGSYETAIINPATVAAERAILIASE